MAVLEDPTGRRARWMRRAGRLVFVVFLAWLLAIVLGGLGLMPVAGIPLTHALRPSAGPPPLVSLPVPRKPSVADLRPAVSAPAYAASTARAAGQKPPVGSRGRSTLAPGQAKKPAPDGAVVRGRSATAPGQTKAKPTPKPKVVKVKKNPSPPVTRGRSSTAPGRTVTTTSPQP